MTEAHKPEDARLYATTPDLLEAAREGLIMAEADVEDRRRHLEEYGEYEPDDAFLAVFIARRDLIAAAILKATTPNAGEEG